MKKVVSGSVVLAAVTWLVACQVLPKGDSVTPYLRGQDLFSAGRAEEAIDAFNEAIRLDPDMPEAYVGRGCSYVIDGKFDKALADFAFAEPHLQERNALLLRYRGAAYVEMNRPEEAIESLEESVEIDPDNAFAHWLMGLAYELQNKLEDSLRELNRAIELDGDTPDLLVDRAGIHLQLEHFDLALADADLALRLSPDRASAYVVRSMIHLALLDFKSSRSDREAALRLDPAMRRAMRAGAGTRRPIVLGPSPLDSGVRAG